MNHRDFTPVCPIPISQYPQVLMAHGGGGGGSGGYGCDSGSGDGYPAWAGGGGGGSSYVEPSGTILHNYQGYPWAGNGIIVIQW